MFVQDFFARGKTFVQMQGLDLEGEAALNVFKTEIAGSGMTRFDNVEKVAVGMGDEEGEG